MNYIFNRKQIYPIGIIGIVYLVSGWLLHRDYLIISFLFIPLIILLKEKRVILLNNIFLQFIGKISYSMYLIHGGVLYLMSKNKFINPLETKYLPSIYLHWLYYFAITFIVTALISYFTYQFIESPFQKIGKKIILKRQM
jgi:peptidoglycan/LPS O-acetylase OafA/YrhL